MVHKFVLATHHQHTAGNKLQKSQALATSNFHPVRFIHMTNYNASAQCAIMYLYYGYEIHYLIWQ